MNGLCLHGEDQEPLENAFHRSIDRPARKGNLRPIAQARFLNVFPNGKRQIGAQSIVEVPDHRRGAEGTLAFMAVVRVAFVAEILEDVVGIERKAHGAVGGSHIV